MAICRLSYAVVQIVVTLQSIYTFCKFRTSDYLFFFPSRVVGRKIDKLMSSVAIHSRMSCFVLAGLFKEAEANGDRFLAGYLGSVVMALKGDIYIKYKEEMFATRMLKNGQAFPVWRYMPHSWKHSWSG